MDRFNISLMTERLTAYAIERQNSTERHQHPGFPSWMEQRRHWTDAILQGMTRLEGRDPAPELMDWYDQRLEAAHGHVAVEPLPANEQAALIRDLSRYVSALETTGDDRRRQIAVVADLLEDMVTHLGWASPVRCGTAGAVRTAPHSGRRPHRRGSRTHHPPHPR